VQDAARRAWLGNACIRTFYAHPWMTEMVCSGVQPIELSLITGASPEVITECYTRLTQDGAYQAMMRALAARGL
jgi:hypothetical protein